MPDRNAPILAVSGTMTDILFGHLTVLAVMLNHTHSALICAQRKDNFSHCASVSFPTTWPLTELLKQISDMFFFFFLSLSWAFSLSASSWLLVFFACSIMLPALRLYHIFGCVNWHGCTALRGSLPVYTDSLSPNNYTQQYQKTT